MVMPGDATPATHDTNSVPRYLYSATVHMQWFTRSGCRAVVHSVVVHSQWFTAHWFTAHWFTAHWFTAHWFTAHWFIIDLGIGRRSRVVAKLSGWISTYAVICAGTTILNLIWYRAASAALASASA